MIFLILIAIFCLSCLIKYNLDKRRLLKYVAHLPSPKSYPLIGCGLSFIGKNTKEIYFTILEMISMQSSTAVWLGSKLFLIVNDPGDVQSVLLSPNCVDKPYFYRFFPFRTGLFTSEAHTWKPNRKLINPSFTMKKFLSYMPIFSEKSKLLVNQLRYKMFEKNFDLSNYIFACTLDITCATLMGFESNVLRGENKDFLEGMERIFPTVGNRIMRFWLHPSLIYKLTRAHQTEKRLYDSILRVTNIIIAERQKYLQNDKNIANNNNLSEDDFNETHTLVVDSLLKLVNDGKITREEANDHLITMLFGGNETSALTIYHTILMLAMHSECQDRVYDELKNFCNLDEEEITYATISKLQYLEMVLKETMRLFPIAPVLGRNCLADTKISNCTIPSGTTIAIIVHHLHRIPDIWGTDAEDFNPDHFLPDKAANRHPYAYIPFSAGTRNCIGIKHGWMSMKVVLAHLLLNFKFSSDLKMNQLKIKWHVVQKISNMHAVKMERRT